MSSESGSPTGAMSTRGDGTASGGKTNDWAAQLTAKVEELVTLVRDRTLTPVVKIVRFVILGLIAIFVGALVAVLFAVGILRVLDTEVFHRRVWASYLVVGGIFSMAGLLLSRMRHRRS